MSNSKTPQELEDRTLEFAANIITFCKKLPKTQENTVLTKQLVRSASSIGANYTEANNAASRLDFRSKIFICKKEASETRFWLKLITRVNSEVTANEMIEETSQLILIFQKIVSTMKNGK